MVLDLGNFSVILFSMDQNNTKCLDLGIITLDEQYKINVYWRPNGLGTMSYEEKLHKLIFVTTWQKKDEYRL